MTYLNPWRVVRPSQTLWGMHHSAGSLCHNGVEKGGIGTINAISIIKLEYDDWIWSIELNESNDAAINRINLEYDDWIWSIVLNASNEQ